MQLLTADNSMIVQKLKHMFKFSSSLDEVKDYAKHIIEKRDNRRVKHIVDKDNVMTENYEKDIEDKLRKYRLKERKHEF